MIEFDDKQECNLFINDLEKSSRIEEIPLSTQILMALLELSCA